MPNEDLELTCVQCGEKFIFTKTEQQQWARRGFVHQPKRCRKCREERRARMQQQFYSSSGYDSNRGIYRAPSFRNEQQPYRGIYRSPMEGSKLPPKNYEITCSKCGETDVIPFKPAMGRDVFCHSCYEEMKKSGFKNRKKPGEQSAKPAADPKQSNQAESAPQSQPQQPTEAGQKQSPDDPEPRQD
jgi:CxxC-x17-CxxC domain-containing protein